MLVSLLPKMYSIVCSHLHLLFLLLEQLCCYLSPLYWDVFPFYNIKFVLLTKSVLQAKNEEEEFNTGPLSVLMMSVKNNTQVMVPSSAADVLSQFSLFGS